MRYRSKASIEITKKYFKMLVYLKACPAQSLCRTGFLKSSAYMVKLVYASSIVGPIHHL